MASLHESGAEQEKLGLLEEQQEQARPGAPSSSSSPSSSSHASPLYDPTSYVSSLTRASALAAALPRAVASTPWRTLFFRFLVFLVPSFLQRRITGDPPRRSEKLYPTAFLDGLRGLASFAVCVHHNWNQPFDIDEAYGRQGSETAWNPLKLPYVRLVYAGSAAVAVFFVISGYAISCKAVRLMRARKWEEFQQVMSSTVFRRLIRLYLPPIASTVLVIVLLRLGAYEPTREFAGNRNLIKHVRGVHPKRMDSAWDQWADWAWVTFRGFHIFGWDGESAFNVYNIFLWTIPVEFRASMLVFVVLVAVARVRTVVRMAIILGLSAVSFRHSRWEVVLFLAGVLIAELDQILPPPATKSRAASRSPLPSPSSSAEKAAGCWGNGLRPWFAIDVSSEGLKRKACICVGILALYFLSLPTKDPQITPGWIFLDSLVPSWWKQGRHRVTHGWGAVLLIFVTTRVPSWQAVLNTPLVQYLGKISYGLYLIHGTMLQVFGLQIERAVFHVTGVEGLWYNVGFTIHTIIWIPLTICLADIFWRAVDAPSVRFARWLEVKCYPKN